MSPKSANGSVCFVFEELGREMGVREERIIVRGNFRLRDLGLGEMGLLELGIYSFSPRPADGRKTLPGPSEKLGLQLQLWPPGVSGVSGAAVH